MAKIDLKALTEALFIRGDNAAARTITIGQQVTNSDVVVIDTVTTALTAAGALTLGSNLAVGGTLAVTGTTAFTGAVTHTAQSVHNGGITSPTGNTSERFGTGCLAAITTGFANFAGGKDCLSSLTEGGLNVGVGLNAGAGITSGDSCMCIGSNTIAEANCNDAVAVGTDALRRLNQANPLGVGIGFRAAKGDNTTKGTGTNFTAIGYCVGQVFTSASNWTGVGAEALIKLTTGSGNTAIGDGAGGELTTGANNTLIGQRAGDLLTGSGSVIIGYQAGKDLTATDNVLWIHNSGAATPLLYGNFSTLRLGVTETDPDDKVHVTVGASEALNCIKLEQLDDSEQFISFQGTSAGDVLNPLTSFTTGNSIQGFLKVTINGTVRYLPFYDQPTS